MPQQNRTAPKVIAIVTVVDFVGSLRCNLASVWNTEFANERHEQIDYQRATKTMPATLEIFRHDEEDASEQDHPTADH